MAGGRIFINYRREDSRGDARSLFERLNTSFPKQVFMDVSKLEPERILWRRSNTKSPRAMRSSY